MQLMSTKTTVRSLTCRFKDAKRELKVAAAAAAEASASVDRKRKAASDAEDDVNAHVRLTRHCYGNSGYSAEEQQQKQHVAVCRPGSPVYFAVFPVYSAVYSADYAASKSIDPNCGGGTPTYGSRAAYASHAACGVRRAAAVCVGRLVVARAGLIPGRPPAADSGVASKPRERRAA